MTRRIFVVGHNGMVGSAILRLLEKVEDGASIITVPRKELDLTNQSAVRKFFVRERVDQVYLAAAKVGGIYANENFPAEFIYENLAINTNVVDAAFRSGVKKLLFLGSSCIYPKNIEHSIGEEKLLTSELESSNEPYALAKIAGVKLCESYNRQYGESHGIDYRCVMPPNLYGPGDNYHLNHSHVIPGLIRRFHDAKIMNSPTVTVWGSGQVWREFLFVSDMAEACRFVMNLSIAQYHSVTERRRIHLNVGSGTDITISELAEKIRTVVGFQGELIFDHNMPEGTRRKLLDSSRLRSLGWRPKVPLEVGLEKTYAEFLKR